MVEGGEGGTKLRGYLVKSDRCFAKEFRPTQARRELSP